LSTTSIPSTTCNKRGAREAQERRKRGAREEEERRKRGGREEEERRKRGGREEEEGGQTLERRVCVCV
jgi:hypothetical protein